MFVYLVERCRNEVRDVDDVGVHLADGHGHVRQGPRPPRLEVVHEVIDDREEVGLEQVQEALHEANW